MIKYKITFFCECSLNMISETNNEEELDEIINDKLKQHRKKLKELLGFEINCVDICDSFYKEIEE